MTGVADAADRTGQPATVVTATAPGGGTIRLSAQDSAAGGLCLDISVDGAGRQDASCPRPSVAAAGDLRPQIMRAGGHAVAYGAVSAGTRSVRLLLSNGRRLRAGTVRGEDYRGGWAGRVRFYAVALRGAPNVGGVHALDGRGRTRAAADLNPLALPPGRGRARLASLTDESARPARLIAVDTHVLSPAPGRPGNRRRAICVGLEPPRNGNARGRAVCATRPTRVEVRYAADCGRRRSILYGIVPSLVRRAEAVLSGGSRKRVRVIRIPSRLGHRMSALLLELPRGTAESVVAYDGSGRRRATVRLTGGSC